MSNDETVTATFYVDLEPQWGRNNWDRDRLRGAKALRLTQNRPQVASGRVVKVTLRLPATAFIPPEVTVDVDIVPDEPVGIGDDEGHHPGHTSSDPLGMEQP